MASNYESPAESDGYDYNAGSGIFGADGQRLGSLSEKGVQNGYLVVHHGTLLGKDAYVPLSCVTDTRQDGIYLNFGKGELGQYDANEAPAQAPQNVGNVGWASGGDTWTYQGQGAPADSGQPINQPAPLRMRAPGGRGAGLGNDAQLAQNASAQNAAHVNAQNMNASNLGTSNVDTTTANQTGTRGAEQVRVPLAEEELIAGKRQTESGTMGLHKGVVEEQKTVEVPTTREEVQVEHRPIAGGAVPADQIGQDVFQEKHIDVPVREEEVVTGKRAQAADEVVINKTPVTENQQVSDTVRRERLHVDDDGLNVADTDQHFANDLGGDQQPTNTQP